MSLTVYERVTEIEGEKEIQGEGDAEKRDAAKGRENMLQCAQTSALLYTSKVFTTYCSLMCM